MSISFTQKIIISLFVLASYSANAALKTASLNFDNTVTHLITDTDRLGSIPPFYIHQYQPGDKAVFSGSLTLSKKNGSESISAIKVIKTLLASKLNYSIDEINTLLQKKSGMLGLTGFSDLREIETEAAKGNRDCLLALQMNTYRIKKYIGSYAAVLNGLDAVVFTAGIGENSELMRKMVCEDLDFLGINIDAEKNKERSKLLRAVNTIESKVKILVIPTNEELEIAKQSVQLFEN